MPKLSRDLPGALSVADLAMRPAPAEAATVEISCVRAINRGEFDEQLQSGLTSRVAIEQARRVRATRADSSMDAASDQRAYARRCNDRLSNVARQLVEADFASEIPVARYPVPISRRNEFHRHN